MKSKVIFEDELIIVVHKPACLATQTCKVGQQDLVSEMKNYLSLAENTVGEPYVGLIHRLDQPVEGILVLAKNERIAKELSSQIVTGKIQKFYYAVVYGTLPAPEGFLTDYLYKDNKTNTSRIADKNEKEAKRAELKYKHVCTLEKNIETPGTESLVRVTLKTGRHHQIRIQMSHAGMPLLGDVKYGTIESRQASDDRGIREVALCAYKLCFLHPLSKKELCFRIEPEGQAFVPYIGKY